MSEKDLNNFVVASQCSKAQSAAAPRSNRVQVCAGIKKVLHCTCTTTKCRMVQWRAVFVVAMLDVGAVVQ